MGSAALGQPGSMVLGGYERSRALGPVGVFRLENGMPMVFLLDILIGTETGASPFDQSDEWSVYKGLGGSETATAITKSLGGKAGSAAVVPNPSAPYIYLPLGTCEEGARHLPVTWNERTGLFVWNTGDPRYSRIVNSPPYLAFVLADRTATNVTIKVPFKLLNLTLEAPLVTSPIPYFPCKPSTPATASGSSAGPSYRQLSSASTSNTTRPSLHRRPVRTWTRVSYRLSKRATQA